MALHVWSSSRYTFPLPEGHRFPVAKYAMLRGRLLDAGVVAPQHVHEPERATREALSLVHTADYIDRVVTGSLDADEQRRLGLPWSPQLVERSYRAVGGTIEAARWALRHGVGMNLAGGTHHAFAGRGEGYCVFNDVAVAIRLLQREGCIATAAVIDLDVHQGNGTNAIFAGAGDVYTFSMHGGRNYPFDKVPGTLDVELEDGTGDDAYLAALAAALPRVLSESSADLVVYLAGVDPHENDRLGRLRLTFDGLARRDAMIVGACREVGIPVAITIAGGYGREIEDTVHAHANTARIARTFCT